MAFEQAIRAGNLEAVKAYITKSPEVINKPFADCTTPLYVTAKLGHTKIAEFLIDRGADFTSPMINGHFELLILANYNINSLEELVQQRGLNLKSLNTNEDGMTPLVIAINNKKTECAKLLIAKGANCISPLTTGKYAGTTPLYFAIETDNIELVELLIAQGADFTSQDILDATSMIDDAPIPSIILKAYKKNIVNIDLTKLKDKTLAFLTVFTEHLVNYLEDNGDIAICAQRFSALKKHNKTFSNSLLIYEYLNQDQFDKITVLLSSTDEYSLNFTIGDQGSLLHVLIQKYADSKDPAQKEAIKRLIKKLVVEKEFDQTIGRPSHPYPRALAKKLNCPESVEILETETQRSLDKIFDPTWDLFRKALSLSCTIENFEVVNSATKEQVFLDEKGVRELLLDKLGVLSSADQETQSQLDPAFIENLNTLSDLKPSSESQRSLSDQETNDLKEFMINLTKLSPLLLLSEDRLDKWAQPDNKIYVDESFLESLKHKPKDPAGNNSYSQGELLTKQGMLSSNQTPGADIPPPTTHVSQKMEK